ncbi:MAG: hypothetical protein PHV33_01730 [Elusimicrobiales bacterium]|nr:hypothetical protein [Elusimicrobiales bacterium]
MKKIITALLVCALPLAGAAAGKSASRPGKPPRSLTAKLPELAPEGKKNPLPGGGWFTWSFAARPKLGTAIIKVQLFDKAGSREKNLEFIGESGMPSMPYHDSGPVKFQLNKKGDYLLPVDLVMAGEWQLTIRVRKEKREIYAAKVLFAL